MRLIPHNHPARVAWNILILCAILAFLFIITYRVVFRVFEPSMLYYALNFLFLADIGVNFITKVKLGHVRIESRSEIRKNYLHTWFAVDVLSAFPFEIVLFSVFAGIPASPHSYAIYLVLQTLTLLKLLKVGRIYRELEESLSVLPAFQRLVFICYGLAASVHMMVIGWIVIGGTEQSRSSADQYIRALYWIITTISTIGYGDYYPDHNSNAQVIYTIFMQLFGVGVFSYIIANVSSLVTNLDVTRSAWRHRLDEINAYMRSQRIPVEMQERVRDYYSFLWSQQRGTDTSAVLADIPHGLSEEILLFLNHDMITRVAIFKNADELFLRESVRLLKPQVFLPGEHIIRQGEFADCMYFLTSGSVRVIVNGAEVARLGSGSPFGETALVNNQLRNASIVSDSYGTGYRLAKDAFNELRAKYPDFDRQVEEIAKSRK